MRNARCRRSSASSAGARSRPTRRRGTRTTTCRSTRCAALAELGVLGVTVPEEHGGAGLDHTTLCLVVEELARHDPGLSVAVAVHAGLTVAPIKSHGTPEQHARLLPPLASGEQLGCYALTEPDAGSDTASIRAARRARRRRLAAARHEDLDHERRLRRRRDRVRAHGRRRRERSQCLSRARGRRADASRRRSRSSGCTPPRRRSSRSTACASPTPTGWATRARA